MTELELARGHSELAAELLRLRLRQGVYDKLFGKGSYDQALNELAAALRAQQAEILLQG